MQLPAALQAWSASLDLFAADLRWPLGGILQKLASAIGPLTFTHSAWDGEPDGFDGLARRGPYDRLLASEWLLADEAPYEFVRRAAMSEHVFLRLARPEPAGDRFTLALFDAGPSQMGAPRLVQLALLVLLARRAEAAHARFGWGIVQEPDSLLGTPLDEAAVWRLIEARTANVANADHVAGWTKRIGSWPRLDDCWWIGGSPLAPLLPSRSSRVLIADVLEPAVRRVVAQVLVVGRLPATVPLDLPPDGSCARLLRDPFGRTAVLARTPATPLRPQSNLVFAPNGTKMYARLGDRGLVAYPIPNSPRAPVGRPRVYETCAPVTAVGRVGRTLLAAVAHSGGVEIHAFGKMPHAPQATLYADDSGCFRTPDVLRPLWGRPRAGATVHGLVTDGNDALFALTNEGGRHRLRFLAAKVLAATWWQSELLIVERVEHERRGVWLSSVNERVEPRGLLAMEAERVLFGHPGTRDEHPSRGPLALNVRGREWVLRTRARESLLIAPEGTRVLGVVRVERREDEAGLLVLEADRRRFTLLGRNWEHELARAPSLVARVTVEPALGLMSYATRDELVVLRLETGTVLLRMPLA